jgi:hypothetical protein
MTQYTIEPDDGNYITYINTGPLTRVEVTNTYWDVTGVGHAKCDSVDTYDENFGMVLANARAVERVSRKVQKAMIKSLDKTNLCECGCRCRP